LPIFKIKNRIKHKISSIDPTRGCGIGRLNRDIDEAITWINEKDAILS
jgi:hypothetical protein